MQLDGHGISTQLPSGWEGRITKRAEPVAVPAGAAGPAAVAPGGIGAAGELTFPVVHLGNFSLPEERGDFGSGALQLMGSRNLFVCLFEYGPDSVGTALFANQGLPRDLRPDHFSARALQRVIPGQAGFQHFFTEANRAFCLFVVLGAQSNAPSLVDQGNQVLSSTTIQAR